MILDEGQLLKAIRRNAPEWYERLKRNQELKRTTISNCIDIAANSDNRHYQDEINDMYNSSHINLNESELVILNFLCLIKHKEHIEPDIKKDNEDVQRWLSYIIVSLNSDKDCYVNSLLSKYARQVIGCYEIKKPPGRPKGSGKTVFTYNGKEYHTIQECADDYHITKQGMFKRLKKNHII